MPLRRAGLRSGPESASNLGLTVDRSLYERLKVACELLGTDDDELTPEELVALALDALFDGGSKET
jgi:hypothetical protein